MRPLGVFGKYSLHFFSSASLVFFEILGSVILYIVVAGFILYRYRIDSNPIGISLALFAALSGVIGTILFFFTLSKTKASVLVPLTALYPVVTVLISFLLLKEKVSIIQGIGIVLAVIASILLSI